MNKCPKCKNECSSDEECKCKNCGELFWRTKELFEKHHKEYLDRVKKQKQEVTNTSNSEKIKVTKIMLPKLLYCYLSEFITEDALKQIAGKFNYKIKDSNDINKLQEELFALGMWLITICCVHIFKDKPYEYLDIFHDFVRHKESKYEDWIKSLSQKYLEYAEALKTKDDLPNPWWKVAKIFNKRLFGEVKKDFYFQVAVCDFIRLFTNGLGEELNKYDIE